MRILSPSLFHDAFMFQATETCESSREGKQSETAFLEVCWVFGASGKFMELAYESIVSCFVELGHGKRFKIRLLLFVVARPKF